MMAIANPIPKGGRSERPFLCRRLPGLLSRGFPNPQAANGRSADWEIGDTAGWETCGTPAQAAYKVQAVAQPSRSTPAGQTQVGWQLIIDYDPVAAIMFRK